MLLTQRSGLIVGSLAKLLGIIINALYNFLDLISIDNIAVCIIIFTFFVRLCMYPLSMKQQRSSKIQNFLQPEFNKITKKYRGKKDQNSILKQNQETRELQNKYGIKMTQGCVTSLIQLPIFFSLYYVIQNIPAYVEKVRSLYTPIAGKIMSVSGNFDIFSKFATDNKINVTTLSEGNVNGVIDVLSKCNGNAWDNLNKVFNFSFDHSKIDQINQLTQYINIAEAPGWHLTMEGPHGTTFNWALLIPVLSFVFQYLSMKVMPMQMPADPAQAQSMNMMKTMTKIMPIFSFVICIGVPAGVGLYWATGSFISFLTTYLTNKYYEHADMEKIVEKAAIKAAKKNEKNKKKGKKSFMDKLTEAASGQQSTETESRNMNQYTSTRLKNYSSATGSSDSQSNNVSYKPGSIASKANAMKQYNDKGGKE